MKRVDKAALKAAIELMRSEGGAERQQIDDMLKTDPWSEVGEFAAMHCQTRALGLPPWQFAPCCINDPDAELAVPGGNDLHGRKAAAELLKRMLAAGVSRWDPDPLQALDAADAKRAA